MTGSQARPPAGGGTAYPCPWCGVMADDVTGCAGCGRAPDADAAAVVRLDLVIGRLAAELAAARAEVGRVEGQLAAAHTERRAALARLTLRRWAEPAPQAAPPQPAAPAWTAAVPGSTVAVPAGGRARRPETSARTVQTVLFTIGGVLLGSAAVVFTTVAWANFGIAGRAALLAAFTALVLAVPPLAGRRGLAGTAETFTALGLLMVLLDGYAVWHVDLGRVAEHTTASWYTAWVFAATALLAVGYRAVWRPLAGPYVIATLLVQPVLPLAGANLGLGLPGWAVLLAAAAAGSTALAWYATRDGGPVAPARRTIAGLAAGLWLVAAGWSALLALIPVATPAEAGRAAGAVTVVAGTLLAVAMTTRLRPLPDLAAGTGVVAVAVAVDRCWLVAWPGRTPVLAAATAVGFAVAAAVLPRRIAAGPVAGAGVVAGLVTAGWVAATAFGALRVAATGLPVWAATGHPMPQPFDWQLPAGLVLGVAALAVLFGDRLVSLLGGRLAAAVAGALPLAGLLALAVPVSLPVAWWGPLLADAVAVPAAVAAVLLGHRRVGATAGVVAAVLAGHAVLTGLGRPVGTVAVFGCLVALGGLVGVLARRQGAWRLPGVPATAVGLLALPEFGAALARVAAPGTTIDAGWVGPVPVPQAGAVAGLLVATAAAIAVATAAGAVDRRPAPADPGEGERLPGYGPVAAGSVAVAGAVLTLVVAGLGGPFGVVGALAAGCVALAALRTPAPVPALARVAMLVLPALAAVSVLPAAGTVLLAPYGWLSAVWSGAPAGQGVGPSWQLWWPTAGSAAGPAAAVTCLLLAAAGVVAARLPWPAPRSAVALALPPAVLAALVSCVAAGAPWPTLPAVSLGTGLAGLLLLALRPWGGLPPVGVRAEDGLPARTRRLAAGRGWAALVAVALVAPGLAGSLATRPVTLVALGAVVVAAAVCGVAGRDGVARTVGWLVFAGAAGMLAFAAAVASGVAVWWSGYWVLAAAAVTFGVSAWLAAGRGLRNPRTAEPATAGVAAVEVVAAEAAAHGLALVGLLLTVGSLRHAAGVCALWALALGLRALLPTEPAGRRLRTAAALGCALLGAWLLLAAASVAVLEAYTVPAALVALAAGWLASRGRPDLDSWAAYGTALLVGTLPSTVSALTSDGAPLRRLGLGVAGVVLVLAGARLRRQAPVVVGGVVVVLVALHEAVLLLDRLPRWIPLAMAGALLVGVATTYERRRRDLGRLRAAVQHLR